MIMPYTNNINNLAEDLEKKLLLYTYQESRLKDHGSLSEERYERLAEIVIKKDDLDLNYMINRLERYYQNGVWIEDGKLYFHHSEISNIGSCIYKKLYYDDMDTAFSRYIELVSKVNINSDVSTWLNINFDWEPIKENFLDKATEYIINNQNKNWKDEAKDFDYKKHRMNYIRNIPESFDDIDEFYFWLNNDRNQECLYYMGSNIIDTLLYQIIKGENYNIHSNTIKKNRILEILESCKNDYITIGRILTDKNIILNCFLLKSHKYFLYGFINLYKNSERIHHNLQSETTDYNKQWLELISNQLVDIFFMHFNNLQNKNEFPKIVFYLLNYLVGNYTRQYNNIAWYKANYTLELVLEKLISMELRISDYEKKDIFSLVVDEVVDMQLVQFKGKNIFDEKSYFLFSYFLKYIEIKSKQSENIYDSTIEKIGKTIVQNLKSIFSDTSEKNKFYIDFNFLDRIDFSLFDNESEGASIWFEIIDLESLKEGLDSSDIYVSISLSQFYIKILLSVFEKTKDKDIAKYINKLVIELGFNCKFSIFVTLNDKDRDIYDKYLEVLNLFDDDLFDEFLNKIWDKHKIRMILNLLSNTISKTRKEAIVKKLEEILNEIDKNTLSLYDLRESILYAVDNGFNKLASDFIEIYKIKDENFNIKIDGVKPKIINREKEFHEIVCKKELIDILEDKDIDANEKFNKLDSYKIPINDKNHGSQSVELKCERFTDFIRALIFFETKPENTYKILDDLYKKEKNQLYLINMLSAYFEAYKNDEYKKEKYQYILNKYKEDLNKNNIKSLFDFQVLLFGYTEIDNASKILYLLDEMPKHYDYDFNIFEYKYQFLKKNEQELKAKEYIKELKEFYKSNQEILKKVEKIEEDLDSYIRINVEEKLGVKISFDSVRLSLPEAKRYWLQIKDMSLEDHAQVFYNGYNIEEFLLNMLEQVSSELLERRVNLLRNSKDGLELEDIINDWFASLFNQRMNYLSWSVSDQKRGGNSSTSKKDGIGERDLLVYDNKGNKVFLFEAFRLFSCDTTKINEHINKLNGYNTDGTKLMIVMSYTFVNDFPELCLNYEKYLKTFNYKGFDPLSSLENHKFEIVDDNKTNIKILKEIRYKNREEVILYHYLLDFKSKK